MVGITGYASYLPAIRIKAEEFKQAWGSVGGGFKEKAVMDFDEDTITMGYEAGSLLLKRNKISRGEISFISLASTNYPYAEKVMSSSLAAMFGLPSSCFTSEHGNSTLAGTEALLEAWQYAQNSAISNSMVIVSDSPRGPINESWENPLGAGAVAFSVGSKNVICEIEAVASQIAEVIGDRFRPEGYTEIQELGIASYSKQAYQQAVLGSVNNLLQKTGTKPSEFKHVVLDQKNGKQAIQIGSKLGFSQEQMKVGMIFNHTGDVGATSPLLGLCAILEYAEPGDRVLLVSYGGGAASQAISLRVSENIEAYRQGYKAKKIPPRYIDYLTYLKLTRTIL